jgi:hypothetical protein
LVFGTMNRNWEEELDIPIGPGNNVEPGGPDQGQPTHFLPGRNRFVFRVRVPADFGKTKSEVVWTLTSPNGKTKRAYATLHSDYFIGDVVIQRNNGMPTGATREVLDNKAPRLKLEGTKTKSVRVGQTVTLTAFANDDGLPKATHMPPTDPRGVFNTARGLRLAWFVYRGAGKVSFDPRQFSVWEDTRIGSNSPWAPGWRTPPLPPDGKWVVQATFGEPGIYVLRCLAHDGGLMTSEDVTVMVAP